MQQDEMTVSEFKEIKDQSSTFLLDVREFDEYQICNLGGHLIPLGELMNRYSEVPVDAQVVVHCKGGGRSRKAVDFLKQKGFIHVFNLKGGITAWIDEIEPDLVK